MPRSPSPATRRVLRMLARAGGAWRHGYDIVRETGIKSGTLYPMLIRLEAQGLLDAEWQPAVERGRPPRHAYRLTAEGRRVVAALPAEAAGDGADGAVPA